MTARRATLLFAALAIATALYPILFGELPVPVGTSRNLVPGGSLPPVRNEELGDVPTEFVPWTTAVADAYRDRRMPWRFSANGCGTPLWGNPQAQAATATTIFPILFGTPWGFGLAAAAKLFLAALGTYRFARRRGLRPSAATWAGVAFGLSLQMTTWMHFPHTWPVALLPWTLVTLERVARRERHGGKALFATVLLLVLGGYPEGEFFVAACGMVFFAAILVRDARSGRDRWRRFGVAAGASLLALGVSAPYTLPAAFAIARGERSVEVARTHREAPKLAAGDFVKPPIYWDIIRFWVVPEAQGNPRDQDKFGPYSFAGRTGGYAGILVLALAIAACARRRAPPVVRAARWALLATALYLLWYPPLVFALRATPGVAEIATRLTTNRANAIFVLLLVIAAAFELDRIQSGGRTRPALAAMALVFAATVVVFVEYTRAGGRPPVTLWRGVSFALPALLLLIGSSLLRGRPGVRRRGAFAALVIAGTALDLGRIGARFNPGTPREDFYPVTPAARDLQQASRGGRFAASDLAMIGVAYMYGLEDVRAYDPVAPADYQGVMGAAAGYTGPAERTARVTRLDAPILDFLNTRARLSEGPTLAVRDAPAAVLPRTLVGAADSSALLRHLAAESDFLRRVHAIGPGEEFGGDARVVAVSRPSPEEIRIRIAADAPRLLVLPETTDGGWRAATADGTPLPTQTANGAFLAVRVPSGDSEILCRYRPPGLNAGFWIGGASAVLAVLLAFGSRGRPDSEQVRDRARVVAQ